MPLFSRATPEASSSSSSSSSSSLYAIHGRGALLERSLHAGADFAGTREGHVYKNGPLGLGYYRDPNVSAMDGSSPASGLQSARAAAPSTASVRAPGTAGGVTKSVRFDPGVPSRRAHTDPRKNYRFLEEGRQRMQQAHMMESLRLPTRVVQPAAYISPAIGNAGRGLHSHVICSCALILILAGRRDEPLHSEV